MNRLTRKYGDKFYINEEIIPAACFEPDFCKGEGCMYKGDRVNCPYLMLLYRLAELEDKIESGELVESDNKKEKK